MFSRCQRRPESLKLNLWTHKVLGVCGTCSEGVWNFSPLSPSADLLPPLRATPPRGLSLLSALKQNEHKARFFALSVLQRAAFSSHTGATRNPNVSRFPGDLCKTVIFQKRSALAMLTDNRLCCGCCISEAGAQFNLVRSNKRARWTQLRAFFLWGEGGMHFTSRTSF